MSHIYIPLQDSKKNKYEIKFVQKEIFLIKKKKFQSREKDTNKLNPSKQIYRTHINDVRSYVLFTMVSIQVCLFTVFLFVTLKRIFTQKN